MLYGNAPKATKADFGLYHNLKIKMWTDYVVKPLTNRYLWVVETPLEKDLLNSLVELDAAVKAMPNPKLNLLELFAQIEELARQLPCDTNPMLLHYLRKKSYQKARLFLQGRDAENAAGNCQHLN